MYYLPAQRWPIKISLWRTAIGSVDWRLGHPYSYTLKLGVASYIDSWIRIFYSNAIKKFDLIHVLWPVGCKWPNPIFIFGGQNQKPNFYEVHFLASTYTGASTVSKKS